MPTNPEIASTTLIRYALETLNDQNGGDKLFEKICGAIVKKCIDSTFLPSSGLSAGGDWGRDGWGFSEEDGEIKYAFSIRKDFARKLNEEIQTWDRARSNRLRFFTNQTVPESRKKKPTAGEPKITIYDLENLVNYLQDCPELYESLGLPRLKWKFYKGVLDGRHQLIEEEGAIRKLCSRSLRLANAGTETKPEDALSFLTEHRNLVIEAPAGFGKTMLLKQLYLEVLRTEDLPVPILVKLKDYNPGGLRTQITNALNLFSMQDICGFTLLMDGYDEIPESDRPTLIKEINQLLAAPGKYKFIAITARCEQYDKSEIKAFDKPFITVRLEGLTESNLDDLFRSHGIDDVSSFHQNELFVSLCQNPFWVDQFIQFYTQTESFAANTTALMEHMSNQEIQLVFKGKNIQHSDIQSVALYMILNEINRPDTRPEGAAIDPDLVEGISTMHRSIIEYLAAKALSQCDEVQIISWVSSLGRIHSYLSNTFGFMLNILTTDTQGYTKATNLLHWGIQDNADKLIAVESENISKALNHEIFKSYFETKSSSADFSTITHFPLQLIESNYSNLKLLVDYIVEHYNSADHEHTLEFCIVLLQRIYLERWENIETKILESDENIALMTVFLDLLENKPGLRITHALFYLICYNPEFKEASNATIERVIDGASKIHNREGVINNLCRLLMNIDHHLSWEEYKKVLAMAFQHMDIRRFGFSVAPSTVDDEYQHPVSTYISIAEFYPLTRSYLESNPEQYWNVFSAFNDLAESREWMESDCTKYYNLLFDMWQTAIPSKIRSIDYSVLQRFVLMQAGHYSVGQWIEPVHRAFALNGELLWKILSPLFEDDQKAWLGWRDISDGLWSCIKEITDFQEVCTAIETDATEKALQFYSYFREMIPSGHVLKSHISKFLSASEVVKITDKEKELYSEAEKRKRLVTKPLQDIVALFSKEAFLAEFEKLFSYVGKNQIARSDLVEHGYFRTNLEINRVVADYCMWNLRNDTAKIDHQTVEQLAEHIIDESWGLWLIDYLSQNSVDPNQLSDAHKDSIVQWVESIISKYPMKHHSDVKYSVQDACCKLLRVMKLSIHIAPEQLLGASLSEIPTTLGFGMVMQHYDTYSIDYLKQYVDEAAIIRYLIDKFDPNEMTDVQAMVACEFIFKNLENVKPCDQHEFAEKLVQYINAHLNDMYQPAVVQMMQALNVGFKRLSEQAIIDALEIEGETLQHNYASHILRFNTLIVDDEDQEARVNLLTRAYNQTGGVLKIRIAELLLSNDHMNSNIFELYAVYLMDDINSIPLSMATGINYAQLYTANAECLQTVEDLLVYALQKSSDKRTVIGELALSSYRQIALAVSQEEDVQRIIASLTKVMKNSGKEHLARYIEQIKTDNASKHKKYISLKEIRDIVPNAI